MMKNISPTVAAYVQSINEQDRSAFNGLFASEAVVSDIGREFRGPAAINAWSDREIFDAQVTLEVMEVSEHENETVVTTKVHGNFDRTGLPDPVIIDHHIKAEHNKIVQLTCRLSTGEPAP